MTKEEAKIKLAAIRDYLCAGNPIWDVGEIREACEMAIAALDVPDTIVGKWIESGLADVIECSECGWIKTEPYWNFCPHCGARMDL